MPAPKTPALTTDIIIELKDRADVPIVLIRRKNPPHGWALPGGFVDVGESVEQAAVREAEEEMGIQEKDVRLLGELVDVCTISTDYCISPFLALIPYPYPFKVNHHEIKEVIEVPLSALRDGRQFREETHEKDGQTFPVYFYQYQNHTIWGATARILKQLLALLPEEEK